MSDRWQSEATPQEWDEWLRLARRLCKVKRVNTSLGSEDYAAQAIEKLVMQENRPVNIEGWLALTIKRQYIDRFKKIQSRGGSPHRDLNDEQWEYEIVSHAIGSPSGLFRMRESVTEVLAILTEKEKEISIMSVAGFDNHDIAEHLGYGTNKIVATRLGQISNKVKIALINVSSDGYRP